MTQVITPPGQVPYISPDNTRDWVESIRAKSAFGEQSNQLLKPNVILRVATDTNHIRNETLGGGNSVWGPGATLYSPYPIKKAQTKAMMNNALPGMRVSGVLTWSVQESADNVVQTASLEVLNCLPVSIIETTLTSALAKEYHSLTITASYATDPTQFGTLSKIAGNQNVNYWNSFVKEGDVRYRTFANQTFSVNTSGFPNPAIPDDDDNDTGALWPASSTGVGSYFLLIDNEVVRVVALSGTTFTIPPGGRAVNGVLEAHSAGARCRLLGYGPYTKERVAFGYLNVDDNKPQTALLRPGTCLVSYEGYGDIKAPLRHEWSEGQNYCFTGYWFITGVEPSLGEDGIPRVRFELKSAGYMYDKQKITQDLLQRTANQFGQWSIGSAGGDIFGLANHDRDIPGDWVDYNSWDPSLPNSYPLKIKTEMAQNKEFFQHMNDTQMGLHCPFCMAEKRAWLASHKPSPEQIKAQWQATPAGAEKERLGQLWANLEFALTKQIGRHIFKESIRVLKEQAGPVKTYIRLMSTLAAAAWDHPAYGTELAQNFTKIPSNLFDNIRNIHTGLIYNGQLDFVPPGDIEVDWSAPLYEDNEIVWKRSALTCPFEATYDRAPFSQPMVDLAEINGNKFWVTREGYPCFVPRLFPFRPSGTGFRDLARAVPYAAEKNEWFQSYGASISGYSPTLNTDSIVTQAWVTAYSAFDTESGPAQFTIPAAGTGLRNGKRVVYSKIAGNRDGLALTSGVQQVDSLDLQNLTLGLDWNTDPEAWGLKASVDTEGDKAFNVFPSLAGLFDTISPGQNTPKRVKRLQQVINFFLERRLMPAVSSGSKFWFLIPVDGKYSSVTEDAVKVLKTYLNSHVTPNPGLDTSSSTWTKSTALAVDKYKTTDSFFLKVDIWWYVHNNKSWNEYVAAMTGVAVPMKANPKWSKIPTGSKEAVETPRWTVDDLMFQSAISDWLKTFNQQAINIGNRRVDDTIDKAVARSISSNMADPRIQPGDTIWCEIPGFLGTRGTDGTNLPPFNNGIYVTNITRTLDLLTGTYTATYGGSRMRGGFLLAGDDTKSLTSGYNFVGVKDK